MSDKLSQFDRRMEILSILRRNKIVKRRMLAQEFSVSKMTISEDLKALNRYAPICAKTGPYGGIYLSSDYYCGRDYLSDKEAALLTSYIDKVSEEESALIKMIIHKFAMPK